MIGAIAGDVIGSIYERWPIKTTAFELFSPRCRFTDDTVLTVAVADALLGDRDYRAAFIRYFKAWPDAGYGGRFFMWATDDDPQPYNSFGNGSAMRVSPVGYAFDSLEEVLQEAERTALPTHNHPEGIKGAQSVAAAVFLARKGESKDAIRSFIEKSFGYNVSESLESIRATYRFDVTCQGSVPQAFCAFLQTESYEDAVRAAVSLGGDSDTQACIVGAVAEAFYGGVPEPIAARALETVDERMHGTIRRFQERYPVRR